ncbi:MAG: 4-hydroxybutyrate CoA-transferase [Planctomycetes bacterium RBG_13_60_9]|nr:MAG: 4-hydroxybutyrate CoA-transferase [Planctomycetes bacterium RBG_13_60_9]
MNLPQSPQPAVLGPVRSYPSLVASAPEAIGRIRPGQRVFIGTGCGQPQALVHALLDRAGEMEDMEIILLVALGEPAYLHRELAQHFRLKPFFIADGADAGTHSHLDDYTPILFSDIPELFRSGRLPIDVALIQVTEPNEHGLCSLGVSVDVTKSAAENAGLVIAQVNPQMPWTAGDGLVGVDDLDILVPCEEPLLEIALPDPGETARKIAEYVAALIPDSSTVQLGMHRIPQALLTFLKAKHDLGIHAEAVSDGIVELLEAGAITGARKSNDRGKIVCSMCLGTRRLFDHLRKNPAVLVRSAQHVSDPAVISRQRNMVAVGLASEIDLMGQVCAHSPGGGFSGMASHADFVHGAAKARGGKMIIALESTRDDGTTSRIVPHLSEGAVVVATCFEVHYVATEYGVAYLHGQSLQERAMALISIAHPDFRARLLREAIDRCYVSSDLATVEGQIHVGPPAWRSAAVLDDGTLVSFRPMHPTDEPRVRDLFHSLSKQTMYYRFMSNVARLPQRQIQNFVYIDFRDEMAIVGTIPEAYGDQIIAVGRYYLDPGTNRAEVAFIVRDNWQNRGTGTFLLKYLATIARGQGIAGFTAEVLADNMPMLAVLRKSGFRLRSQLDGRVHSIELDFE